MQVNFFTRGGSEFFCQSGKMFLPLKVFQKRYRFQFFLKILAKIRRMNESVTEVLILFGLKKKFIILNEKTKKLHNEKPKMKLSHKIFRNYRHKSFLGHRKLKPRIYKEFITFAIRSGNGIYQITEDDNISDIKKYWIVLDYRQQS